MPERSQSGFSFAINFLRRVEAWFEAEAMTSNAGGLLLRETDRRLNLLPRPVRLFLGGRIDQPRAEIVLIWIGPTWNGTAARKDDLSTVLTTNTAVGRCISSVANICCACGKRLSMLRPAVLEEVERIMMRIREHWPETRNVLRSDLDFCRDARHLRIDDSPRDTPHQFAMWMVRSISTDQRQRKRARQISLPPCLPALLVEGPRDIQMSPDEAFCPFLRLRRVMLWGATFNGKSDDPKSQAM
jgi:hypothetical protein